MLHKRIDDQVPDEDIHSGRLDASKTITMRDMFVAGVFHSAKFGIKILARV